MKRISVILLSVFCLLLSSCSRSARVSGDLSGVDTLTLEYVAPTGVQVVDSVLAKEGRFDFRVKLPDGEAIYNIKGRGFRIPLVLAPGQRVSLSGAPRDYRVDGSVGSGELREIQMLLNRGAATLDSIDRAYVQTLDTALARQYIKEYYRIKQQQIRLIVLRPSSLASLYGLYQRLPGDATLFNGATDVVYYRTIADSLAARTPDSPYLPALRREIARMEPLMGAATEANYPDIELPDMYGKPVRLSSLDGQVILLDFWSASSQQSRLLNAELKETYERFEGRGLAIYQVGVDTDKALWVSLVQEQRLPWVSVCDFRGGATPALGMWNVSTLPANFLIDRGGNIVARNLYGAALDAKLSELLR